MKAKELSVEVVDISHEELERSKRFGVWIEENGERHYQMREISLVEDRIIEAFVTRLRADRDKLISWRKDDDGKRVRVIATLVIVPPKHNKEDEK